MGLGGPNLIGPPPTHPSLYTRGDRLKEQDAINSLAKVVEILEKVLSMISLLTLG